MKLLSDLIAWWNRPSAEERILAAMSFTEWRRGLAIIIEADVFVADFYIQAKRLEEAGIIVSMWSEEPLKPERGYRAEQLFRKLKSGSRSRKRRWQPFGGFQTTAIS